MKMSTIKGISIGEVARRTDLGVETIRFYEREGLIDEPPRKLSGYRQYPEEVIARIRFIRRSKELGFSLKEIRELIALQRNPNATCMDVRRQTEAKIVELENKIVEFQKMRDTLTSMMSNCRNDLPVQSCPVLNALCENHGPHQ